MRSLHLVLGVLVATSLLACVEYKAEPENGKQACATGANVKQCPDNYQCVGGVCCKNGMCPAGNGGSGGGGSSGGGGKGGTTTYNPGGAGGGGGSSSIPVADATVCCSDSTADACYCYPGLECTSDETQVTSCPSSLTCCRLDDMPSFCLCWPLSCSYTVDAEVGASTSVSGCYASTVSTGGSTGTTSSGDVTTFSYGAAVGVLTGYGWVAMGRDDILTDPTCGTSRLRITNANPCTTVTNWNSSSALCISGTIPELPASPTADDYNNNWGIQIGVNATEPPASGIGRTYSTISATVSNAPSGRFRLMLHRKEDPDTTTYCLDSVASGAVMNLTRFNTKCWGDATTVLLTSADVPNIDKVGIQFSSTSTAITLSNACLSSITFGK